MYRLAVVLILAVLVLSVAPQAQAPAPGVPRLVPASGMLFNEAGNPLNGNNVKITFSVYAGAEDEVALWSETLRLTVVSGRYDALIGSSSPGGIPASVFAAGEPRWLGVTADKAVGPQRALLVSVPYALTADDAAKLGGYPVSAFVLKDEATASKSNGTPAGWKQAVDEEAAARESADTGLQENLDAETSARSDADSALQNSLDDKSAELDSKLAEEKAARETKDTELNTKVDQKSSELNTKIDSTKSELDAKILFETSKVTADQDAKLLALKNELKSDSTEKVNEIDQKKTSKEDFELEKTKKQQEIEELKLKKTSKEEFEQEKAAKQIEINDLKEKKLSKEEYLLEKALLEAKKLDKTLFDNEKTLKDAALLDLARKIEDEKKRVDTLQRFVVSFAREPNGDPQPDRWMCPEGTVAIGVVGQTADVFGTASPFCSPVTGATVRADGNLTAAFDGPFAVPGLQGTTPSYELMCPAAHAVVGIGLLTDESGMSVEDENGNSMLTARCRRLFSNIEVNSTASVPVSALPPGPICPADQTAAGVQRSSGSVAVVCR